MDQLDDLTLIDETLGGSDAAFELLMRRYERLVFKLCYSFTRDRDDALDVTQEVFVRAYEKLSTYRGGGSFKGWLMRLAHNVNLTWIRSRRRDAGREEISPANAPPIAARQETDLLRREERELILGELERLSARQALAVNLRYF